MNTNPCMPIISYTMFPSDLCGVYLASDAVPACINIRVVDEALMLCLFHTEMVLVERPLSLYSVCRCSEVFVERSCFKF